MSKVREIESSPSPPNWGNGKWASEWTQICCSKVPFLFVSLIVWLDGRSYEYDFTPPTVDWPIILGLNQRPKIVFCCIAAWIQPDSFGCQQDISVLKSGWNVKTILLSSSRAFPLSTSIENCAVFQLWSFFIVYPTGKQWGYMEKSYKMKQTIFLFMNKVREIEFSSSLPNWENGRVNETLLF